MDRLFRNLGITAPSWECYCTSLETPVLTSPLPSTNVLASATPHGPPMGKHSSKLFVTSKELAIEGSSTAPMEKLLLTVMWMPTFVDYMGANFLPTPCPCAADQALSLHLRAALFTGSHASKLRPLSQRWKPSTLPCPTPVANSSHCEPSLQSS